MRPNRSIVFALLVVGAVCGFLPFAAFLGGRVFPLVFTAVLVITCAIGVFRLKFADNEPPVFAEYVCSLLAACGYVSGGSIIAFASYGITYELLVFTAWLSHLTGSTFAPDPHTIAKWPSMGILLLVGPMAAFTPIARTLYPDVPGVISAYDVLIQRPSTLAGSFALAMAGVLLSFAIWQFDWSARWQLAALVAIVVGSQESMSRAINWRPTTAVGKEAAAAIAKLFAILGYQTITEPRTKDQNTEIDSVLRQLDLIATNENTTLAVELKTPIRAQRPVSALEASTLQFVAKTLSRYLSASDDGSQVDPVLVLVGRDCTAETTRFAEEEHLVVVHVESAMVQEVLGTEDQNRLRELAAQYLAPVIAAMPQSAVQSVAT